MHHRYHMEHGGVNVETWDAGHLVLRTWTSGTMAEARVTARQHRALILGLDVPGCCRADARCDFHRHVISQGGTS